MATGVPKRKNGNGGAHTISLEYPGKRSVAEVLTTPASEVSPLWRGPGASDNRLYFGDNLGILVRLARDPAVVGKVRLVYIDPPFATQTVFHSRTMRHAYEDTTAGADFIDSLRARMVLLRELLADDGSIYLHLDDKMVFHMKLVMDEIFGADNYRNCITRKKCNPKNYTRLQYGNVADYLLFYTKTNSFIWNRPVEAWTEARAKEYQYVEPETGRRFMKVPVHAPGLRNGETGKPWRGMMPPPGKHWQFQPATLDEMDARGEIYWSSNGNPRRKVYLDQSDGIGVQDIWLDFRDAHNQNICVTGYPTEKNPALLRRIIEASSNPGDLVLDCFAGSGTTLAVASEFGRRWIGVDNSVEAITTTLRRFAHGTAPMGDFVSLRNGKAKANGKQETLPFAEATNGNGAHKPVTDFAILGGSGASDDLAVALGEWIGRAGPGATERSEADLSQAALVLASGDKILKKVIDAVGACEWRKSRSGFAALARAIIGQQLSKSAAQSIERKAMALFKSGEIEPHQLLALKQDDLVKSGLSGRKVESLKGLATAIVEGRLDLDALDGLDDEAVIETLCAVKGIGRWTAEMYLIFSMLRPDVLPLDDAALRRAMVVVYGIDGADFERRAVKIAEAWRPYRSVACWYLYAYLDHHHNKVAQTRSSIETDRPMTAVV